MIGYNKTTIKSIIRNLPQNYEFNQLPSDLLRVMYEMSCYSKIIISTKTVNNGLPGKINIYRDTGEQLSKYSKTEYREVTCHIKDNLIAMISGSYIYIHDFTTKKDIRTIHIKPLPIINVCYDQSKNQLIVRSCEQIHIVDFESEKIIHNLTNSSSCSKSKMEFNGKYLAVINDNNTVAIWNLLEISTEPRILNFQNGM